MHYYAVNYAANHVNGSRAYEESWIKEVTGFLENFRLVWEEKSECVNDKFYLVQESEHY